MLALEIILPLRHFSIWHPSQVPNNSEGLEAIIFTADGDMRQALNNLQVSICLFLLLLLGFSQPVVPICTLEVQIYGLQYHTSIISQF